ncbi:aa3-type cytochrome oxidase subunit III [Naumannella huperziae]|uniref:cytochrome-c oxidase n=1 Tax=Naumannella cuiyingiana TaxID=1347891 RepID=A0A7Z0ILU0_9ACTN|nr:cytochrome c oxidase subunit 3 [Naumannella cuiyingiana]
MATSIEAVGDAGSARRPDEIAAGALHRINPARLNGVKGRPDLAAIGTMVWLASDLMFFAGLFAAYFTIQNVTDAQAAATGGTALFEWGHSLMNIPFTVTNTAVLVASSFTCQMGVFAAHRRQVSRTGSILNPLKWGLREWYILTFVMGAFFIGGQVFEYATLFSEGLTIYSDPYGSIFFLATGFHGLHVTGGLIAFVFVLGRTYLARTFTHEQYVSTECVSYYWHFVDVVWVALFFVIYLLPFLTY